MNASDDRAIVADLMRFKPEGLTPNGWAVEAGVNRTVWADMRRHGNPSRRTLEKLLVAAGSSLAEFEALRVGSASLPSASSVDSVRDRRNPWGSKAADPLPLVETSLAGEWDRNGQTLEMVEIHAPSPGKRLNRPQALAFDAKAFAMVISGNSMEPRFRRGRAVAVSPSSPVVEGDDVLVRLRPGRDPARQCAVLGRLVSRTSEQLLLRRHTPATDFTIPARDIERIEKIAGELI